MDIQSLAALSDTDLLACTKRLARHESRATVALIAHLAEIDTRKLYLGEACSSLFMYCIRVLHLSEPAAYNRIQAARVARRFPVVLTGLERGVVHLAAVRLLAPVLTVENHRALLASAAHKSKREVEELVARLRPQPDVPGRVRKLPAAPKAEPATQKAATARGLFESPESSQPARAKSIPSNGSGPELRLESQAPAMQPNAYDSGAAQPRLAQASPPQRPTVAALAPERYKVQFTAGAATRDKLRRAQELLRHRIPDGDIAQVIDLALDLLVRDLEKQKFAATDPRQPRRASQPQPEVGPQPRPASQPQAQVGPQLQTRLVPQPPSLLPSPSRYIPAAVRRAVWERDRGQRAFVNTAGARCTERGALEFDHIQPHADGGCVDLQNVRLLCRQHNQHEAERFFGLWHTEEASQAAARCW